MRVAYYETTGPARDVLKLGTVDDPKPAAGEVLVKGRLFRGQSVRRARPRRRHQAALRFRQDRPRTAMGPEPSSRLATACRPSESASRYGCGMRNGSARSARPPS